MATFALTDYPELLGVITGPLVSLWSKFSKLATSWGYPSVNVPLTDLKEMVLGSTPPAYVLGWYWSVFSEVSPKIYRERGIKTIVLMDDLHESAETKFRHRISAFRDADLILVPYYTRFLKIPEYRPFWDKAVRFPWAAPAECFECRSEWNDREDKVLLSGAMTPMYTLRRAIRDASIDLVEVLDHPGYPDTSSFRGYSHPYTHRRYYEYCSRFKGAVATSLAAPLDYLISKYFEIPACGCLPFFEPHADLDLLGFVEEEHYIAIDQDNFPGEFPRVKDAEAEGIAARAREFVRSQHTDVIRARELIQIVEERFGSSTAQG